MIGLNANYEISVWLDKLGDDGQFHEERICVIGSDSMQFQGRAIEPILTRNINGEKNFSFKMYKQFVDDITGEKVDNPFSEYLINEAKIKLHYEDKWYDFYIKNVVENSSTYLYSYDLADASVQELSKNGYGVTFDAKLMEPSNLGTVKELARRTIGIDDAAADDALGDGGWKIESEVFVERVQDNLVYLKTTQEIEAVWVKDQTDLDEGVNCDTKRTIPINSTILAFYSSCKNKPHRFQFIYLSNYNKDQVLIDEDNNIIASDCQYYYDIPQPQNGYQASGDFYVPTWATTYATSPVRGDTVISVFYKAKRYGFAQKTQYVPLLDRYCNLYKKSEGGNAVEYYGYFDSEYKSPILINNIITNAEFKGNTGWTGTYFGNAENQKNIVGAKVESICGRFVGNPTQEEFYSAMDDLQNGRYNTDNTYTNYLKVEFPTQISGCNGVLINSGFYDNRKSIEVPQLNEIWHFDMTIYNANGESCDLNNFDIYIGEVAYNTDTGGYILRSKWTSFDAENQELRFENNQENGTSYDSDISPTTFQNKSAKLIICPKSDGYNQTYYIEAIHLYKKIPNNKGGFITPDNLETEGIVVNNYVFVKADLIDENTSEEDLAKTIVDENDINYNLFVPQYNDGAEKVRTITAKESNYFNIFQTIAETFECWMDIVITRDAVGGILDRTIKFKNYTGQENYACFRYGVNLQDIQRTFESKQLATKLIVKQNNNQLGDNGFCTITRAGSNPTGENYIYDFGYFHKTGLLDATQYQAQMYYDVNPLTGIAAADGNLQNYCNRIKAINEEIEPMNGSLVNLNMDLLKLKADMTVQEGLRDAASAGEEEAREEFFDVTGLYPTEISPEDIVSTGCGNGIDDTNEYKDIEYDSKYNYKILNPRYKDANVTFKVSSKYPQNSASLDWKFEFECESYTAINKILESYPDQEILSADQFTGGYKLKIKVEDETGRYGGAKIILTDSEDRIRQYTIGRRYKISYSIKTTDEQPWLSLIGTHCASFKDTEIYIGNGSDKAKQTLVSKNDRASFGYIVDANQEVFITIYGTYYANDEDAYPYLFIQPNRGEIKKQVNSDATDPTYCNCEIHDLTVECCDVFTSPQQTSFYIQPIFKLQTANGNTTFRDDKIAITVPPYSVRGTLEYIIPIVNHSSRTSSKILQEYVTYQQEKVSAAAQYQTLSNAVEFKEAEIQQQNVLLKQKIDVKKALNSLFYSQYNRFIQEGTWMSEDYVDDDKYYNDALSVLYSSCYPQVAYNIKIVALHKLPGYELFKFELGENTYVEDPDFLGEDLRVKVAITEIKENLDDATQSTISVQNFKNQFQDLFHRITATVQQAQYNSGAYEKAVELAEADAELKGAFLHEGLQNMSDALSIAGQTTVVQDAGGITLTDSNTKNQMRLIGGAILMGVEDQETGTRRWKTGLTPDGISASLIQAGTVNTGIINIMNATEPTFKWDSFGISAYDVDWTGGSANGRVNPYKFVRFDKHGIYGIDSTNTGDNESINGEDWHPSSIDEIDTNATFALTWEGLKVTGNEGVEARIGKNDGNILAITKNAQTLLNITNDGILEIAGTIKANDGYLGSEEKGWKINESSLTYGKIADSKSFILSPYGYTVSEHKLQIGKSDSSTVWVMTIDKNMGISNNGTLYAKNADIEGIIAATKGSIGAWSIGEVGTEWGDMGGYPNSLYSETKIGDTKYLAFLRIPENADDHLFSIREKKSNNSISYPFYITKNGYLFCNEGRLGPNMEIKTWLNFTAIGFGDAFKITSAAQPPSEATVGSFYSLNEELAFITFRSSSACTVLNSSTLQLFVNRQGTLNKAICTCSSASLPGIDFYFDNGTTNPYFFKIHGKNQNGKSFVSLGNDTATNYELEFVNTVNFSESVVFNGTVFVNGEVVTSDKNYKNTILTIPQNYDILFNALNPVIFKYNNGTSDRFHSGFIAQEVDAACKLAQISRKDFSAICIDNEGTENEKWGIRYSNFISINTWQIQLLKPRMTAAEEKITQLELEISSLKSELENLKKS